MKFKKYLPYIFLFMLFLTTLAVNMQIGLFGDDYYYATFTRENFWSMHLNHYQEANGRAIVHILEQAAMMAFCLTLLLLFYALIKGEKYKTKNILILLVISFLGMATVIFAPSQFIRIGLETDENVSIFETIKNNLLFLIKDYAPEYAYQIIVAMISVISFFLFRGKRSEITSDDIFLLITIFILGAGSQIMMFVSPVYGERNTIFIAFMLMLFTGFMFSKISFKSQKVLHGISISFYGILIIVSLINIYDIYKKYKISNNIQNQNILAINEYKLLNNTNTLYLKKLEDEKYGWSMPYNSPYHEQWFKIYYKIKDTNIVWID